MRISYDGYCSHPEIPLPNSNIPIYRYKIINTYPHDPNAFTQGLVFENGFLYEGTGLYGCSSLRKTELETGKILKIRKLSEQFFGEGLSIYKDKVIQLTWQSYIGFVYDKNSFELLQVFNYFHEGWGVTYDGKYLIISDGTAILHFLDPETFEKIGQIEVYAEGISVTGINELEFIDGNIYANIWQTEYIAIISPETGQVTGWIDLKGILKSEDYYGQVEVLNGIAYDLENKRLFVTGKFWPVLFEIGLCENSQ